ncbi:hypothetical protein BpHYR1_021370 [Brachionus plicatilis]|uniref:Uncharacterized protein n=1 Tax=Brachionus plicatilis TaxID=10195 RepID=A0A3M7Q8Q9_BRAPC|nr:hypothetical protein BpHYR1_021370 [Brachionus plicatilis]
MYFYSICFQNERLFKISDGLTVLDLLCLNKLTSLFTIENLARNFRWQKYRLDKSKGAFNVYWNSRKMKFFLSLNY